MGQTRIGGILDKLSSTIDLMGQVTDRSPDGKFARVLARIDNVTPDQHGNIVINSTIPRMEA